MFVDFSTSVSTIRDQEVWHNALEGWNMTDSPCLNEYILEAEQKGHKEGFLKGQQTTLRANVALVLKMRFKTKVTREVSKRIKEESDLAVLRNWFSLVFEVDSWDEFQTQFNRQPCSKRCEIQPT